MSTIRFLGLMAVSICARAQMGRAFPSLPPAREAMVVSLRELEHPIPYKAMREAYQAQKLANANRTAESIARFEKAIRIYPQYRDARVDLGVEYARAGRLAEARGEFQKALDIGPPVPAIYFDLALSALAFNDDREAEAQARKALALDPAHQGAKRILEHMLTH